MTDCLLPHDAPDTVAICCVAPDGLARALAGLGEAQKRYVAALGFEAQSGRTALLPDADGAIERVLFGLGAGEASRTPWLAGRLAETLPAGNYRFDPPPADAELAALAFALGRYRFDAYRRKPAEPGPRLAVPAGVDEAELRAVVDGVTLARDLINTPANDMGPDELEAAARTLADTHGASFETTRGEALLAVNLPMIHAVGRASTRAPRLVDFLWGSDDHPKVTLVGKGVCFDTGGLDIKPSNAMALMKKDMGGAANVLGLAAMIMAARLPVRLRVLIPAVENAISGAAFRPGDVLQSRRGTTVSIGNTDAEGRLVLADAMTLAGEEKPDLMIDMATLTGAARVALGPEIPPLFTRHDDIAEAIAGASREVADPVWRLPLWQPYERFIESKVADVDNAGTGGFAGSITAALFLARFVDPATRWAHFDIYGWNPSARPGRPEGGEAQAIRALYRWLRDSYGSRPAGEPTDSP